MSELTAGRLAAIKAKLRQSDTTSYREWEREAIDAEGDIRWLIAEVERIQAENVLLRAAIEAVDWMDNNGAPRYCTWCGKDEPYHWSDCQRQVALGIEVSDE